MKRGASPAVQDEETWWEVRVTCPLEATDPVSGLLWDLGARGVQEEAASRNGRTYTRLRASFQVCDPASVTAALAPRLEELEAYFPGTAASRVTARRVEVKDWNAAWKAHFQPEQVTSRLVVRPSWVPFEAGAGQVVLTIDPGMAFGTGTHETTRGCLRFIDALYGGDPVDGLPGPTHPRAVLDVGTGSGILLLAAMKLGAEAGVGTDVDPLAIEAALENLRVNGLSAHTRVLSAPLPQVEGRFDLVLANILAPDLIDMAPDLAAHLSPGGVLILSGILTDQAPDVVGAFQQHGLVRRSALTENAWTTLAMVWRRR